MKIKVVWILLLGICIMGYNSSAQAINMVKALVIPQKQLMIVVSHLKIINAISTVRHGGTGVITIQGIPNTLYNIKTSYKTENKTVSVIQWRTTDRTGVTTFNWIVGDDTVAGTYPASISGGGELLNTSHTVVQN